MIFDVQFGDKYTINGRGALCQYRGGNARLLGNPEWFFSGPCDDERDIPYTLFRQVAEAAGHTPEERTVCYRAKKDGATQFDRYRVWPDGEWCGVFKDGDTSALDPDFNPTGLTRCEDAPLPAEPQPVPTTPAPVPQPATKTLTVWAGQYAYDNKFVHLYTTEQQAMEMSAKGTPIHRIELPIAETKENNRE